MTSMSCDANIPLVISHSLYPTRSSRQERGQAVMVPRKWKVPLEGVFVDRPEACVVCNRPPSGVVRSGWCHTSPYLFFFVASGIVRYFLNEMRRWFLEIPFHQTLRPNLLKLVTPRRTLLSLIWLDSKSGNKQMQALLRNVSKWIGECGDRPWIDHKSLWAQIWAGRENMGEPERIDEKPSCHTKSATERKPCKSIILTSKVPHIVPHISLHPPFPRNADAKRGPRNWRRVAVECNPN